MKSLFFVAVLLLAGVTLSFADRCQGLVTMSDSVTSYSCDDYGSSNYNITVSKPTFATVKYRSSSSSYYFYLGPNTTVPTPGRPRLLDMARGTGSAQKFVIPTGTTTGSSYMAYSGYSQSISIELSQPKYKFFNLFPGARTTVSESQPGGYIYFKMENMYLGGAWSFRLNVNEFNGLQPPNMLVSYNDIPTLENYMWSNQSSQVGSGHYESEIARFDADARDGSYYVAVFLYGSFGSVTIDPVWLYSDEKVKFMTPGALYSGSASFSSKVFYAIQVPKDVSAMNVQFSRQVPGGFPNLFVRPGQLPLTDSTDSGSDGTYLQRLATTEVNSYYNVNFDNPNPSTGSPYLNANYWFFTVNDFADSSSGYLLKVSFQ